MSKEKEILEEMEETVEETLEETPKTEEEKDNSEEATVEPKEEAKEEKKAEDEALEVKYMRLMADFQNFRRRTEKEKNDTYLYANEKIVKELLDVIDNFERAFSVDSQDEGFKQGMEMIFKQLQAVLERAGLVEIDCLGQDFDPNFENAVMTEDSAEYDSGKVTKVLQKGYKLHDRVVRPAMVVTAN